MSSTLQVDYLKKSYGKKDAVKGISFEVGKGEIFALIGPNGAGKTTTLRMIATLLKPLGGDAFVDDLSVIKDAMKVREMITYLPDEAGAYKNMKGLAYLNFMASLYCDDSEKAKAAVQRATEICGLGDRLADKIGSYSKGMTRKLLIARAVMTNPKLAILDEPTNGLDILNALEIRQTIKRLASEGVSFLISSHNMLEIEFLSDRVGIINDGVLHITGTPKELKEKYSANNLEEVFSKAIKE